MIVFTINLLVGLTLSQLIGSWFEPEAYAAWRTMIKICTMFCLSYIMIHVGYEFDIDKTQLGAYGKDYLIAMTAAGFPWLFVAGWFIFVLPHPLPWDDALVAARFAARCCERPRHPNPARPRPRALNARAEDRSRLSSACSRARRPRGRARAS